jgi:hypothetical protein
MIATVCAAICFAGCAADTTQDSDGNSEGLLATLQLSDTHVVSFYEVAPGHGSITERYDLQTEERSALSKLEVRDGELLPAYLQLAGVHSEPQAIARLESYEDRRLKLPPSAAVDHSQDDQLFENHVSAYAGPVDKDRNSEAHWFAGRFCDSEAQPDGCLGHDGARYDWLPTDLPVCSTPVELCGTGFADPFRQYRTSKNIRWAAYNQGDSGTITAILYLTDPCANQSWWKDLTTVCKQGSLVRQIGVGPHAAFEAIDTASSSWRRALEVSGGHPIGVKMNAY